MQDQYPLSENEIEESPENDQAEGTESREPKTLAFSLEDEKAAMSFELKSKYSLPDVTVKHLLNQFASFAKKDREDKTLQAVLRDVAMEIGRKRGELSPMYLAIKDYAEKKGATMDISVVQKKISDAAGRFATETSNEVESVFSTEEVPSAVRTKLSSIFDKNLELPDIIKLVFPSMKPMLVNTLNLKLLQGPTQEEEGNPLWHIHYFFDLVQRFDSLREDLREQQFPLETVARMLVALGQREANRAANSRASRRDRFDTVVGMKVDQLALEKAIASVKESRSTPAGVEEDGQKVADDKPTESQYPEVEIHEDSISPDAEQGDDIHKRVTYAPGMLNGNTAEDIYTRETITTEVDDAPAEDPKDLQNSIPTVPVNVAEVRDQLLKAGIDPDFSKDPAIAVHSQDTDEPVAPPKKNKGRKKGSGVMGAIRGLVGKKDKENE